jgi:hypothetical protein
MIGRNRLSDRFRSIQPSQLDTVGAESRRHLESDRDDRSHNG